jgi:hypothetical protein
MRYLVLGCLLLTTPVWAGNLCYTSSAAEDAQLADAATRDGLTVQQEINADVSKLIASKYQQSVHAALGGALENAWPGLTALKKSTICTQLSVSPCPP